MSYEFKNNSNNDNNNNNKYLTSVLYDGVDAHFL